MLTGRDDDSSVKINETGLRTPNSSFVLFFFVCVCVCVLGEGGVVGGEL